ncbi:MAG: hypothetical protein IJR14_08445, partial [Synergistaceae bacterium]|nr:hypothetical protein [Synergistaceae bacterium]
MDERTTEERLKQDLEDPMRLRASAHRKGSRSASKQLLTSEPVAAGTLPSIEKDEGRALPDAALSSAPPPPSRPKSSATRRSVASSLAEALSEVKAERRSGRTDESSDAGRHHPSGDGSAPSPALDIPVIDDAPTIEADASQTEIEPDVPDVPVIDDAPTIEDDLPQAEIEPTDVPDMPAIDDAPTIEDDLPQADIEPTDVPDVPVTDDAPTIEADAS